MAKILLLEDDRDVSATVADCLRANHVVEQAYTFQDAKDRLSISVFELLILDWNLPDGDGVELLKEFRSKGGAAPVIMLTAKSDVDDKVTGFECGADDYIAKPFHLKELMARINAVLKRPQQIADSVLSVRDLTLEPKSRIVKRAGTEVKLLPKEFALLEFLLRNTNAVFSATELLDRVWPSDSEVAPDTVTTTVKRMRKKIDRDGEPSIVETVFGVGYKINK